MASSNKTRLIIPAVFLMLSSLWGSALSQSTEKAKYFTVDAETLEVRESPNLTSKVLAVLQYCDKVLFLEDPKIEVTIAYSHGPRSEPLVKIRTANNVVGYVFKYSLSQYKEINYTANQSNFKIEGKWPKYLDDPNVSYYFYKNGKFDEVFSNFDEPLHRSRGRYVYDGCCKINIVMDDGERITIDVINVNSAITLKEKCFIFDPELRIEYSEFEPKKLIQ